MIVSKFLVPFKVKIIAFFPLTGLIVPNPKRVIIYFANVKSNI